jgi:hypothetical protein
MLVQRELAVQLLTLWTSVEDVGGWYFLIRLLCFRRQGPAASPVLAELYRLHWPRVDLGAVTGRKIFASVWNRTPVTVLSS